MEGSLPWQCNATSADPGMQLFWDVLRSPSVPQDSQTSPGHPASVGCRDRESPWRRWGFLGPGWILQMFSGLCLGSERQIPPAPPWFIMGCWLTPKGAPWGATLL